MKFQPQTFIIVIRILDEMFLSISDTGTMEDEIGDDTTVIVNVNDLVSRAEVDLGLEQLLMEDFSDQRLMRPGKQLSSTFKPGRRGENNLDFFFADKHVTLAAGISEYWHTKEFSDVDLICGLDGGSVQAHKIVLAGVSPLFKSALQAEPEFCAHEKCVIMLPGKNILASFGYLSNHT